MEVILFTFVVISLTYSNVFLLYMHKPPDVVPTAMYFFPVDIHVYYIDH
jgi:hypothetical protein